MPAIPPPAGDAALPVADILALHELLARYGHVIDERQWDRFADVFTADCHYDASDFGMPVWDGLAALTDGMRGSDAHPVAHQATNIVIGAPEADGSVRILSKGLGVGVRGRVGSAVYDDIAVRTSDGWRLSSRVATLRRPEPRT
jgi:hypothetical protein